MALPFNHCLFLLLLFLFPLIYFASVLSEGFNCGEVGYLGFPFAKHTHPECGLVSVNCDAKPHPMLQLGMRGEWYPLLQHVVKPFVGTHVIFLADSKLNYTIYFLVSPSISFLNFEADELIALLKCSCTQSDDMCNCNCIDGFSFYYKNKNPLVPQNNPKCDTANCTLYPTPFFVPQTNSPLTAQFGLELQFSKLCYDYYYGRLKCTADGKSNESQCAKEFSNACNDCYNGEEGKCATDINNEFKPKKGKSKLRVILIILFGGFALILVSLAIFVVWRRKKESKGSSRNTSSDPTSDPEKGQSMLFGILVFSYSQLEEATNNFDPSKHLGDGGFGTVYYGMLQDGREVAVKRLHERNCKRTEQFINEISILTRIKHPNLVTLYGCTSRHNRELLLVYEYIANGTLEDHLHGEKAAARLLTWPIRIKIAVETAAALVYLHASDIIHRDVKTSNILLDENFSVKVADFGLSRLFPANVTHATTTPQGTAGYVDPDYRECYQLTYKSDVYSFGVVLIELISSMPAVDIRRRTHEVSLARLATNKILVGAFDELVDSALGYEMDSEIRRMTTSVAELAFQCLQPDKDTRPTMEKVLESLKEIRGVEDERVNGEETSVSSMEEEPRRKAVTWAGPSLTPRGILKHVAARKSSS